MADFLRFTRNFSVYSGKEKNSKEDEALNNRVDAAMFNVYLDYDQLKDAYSNLDNMVKEAVELKKTTLNGKFKGRLAKAKEECAHQRQKLIEIDQQMEHDPMIYYLQDEIEAYKKSVLTLKRTLSILNSNQEDMKSQILDLQDENFQLKNKVKIASINNLHLTHINEQIKQRIVFKIPTMSKIKKKSSSQQLYQRSFIRSPKYEPELKKYQNAVKNFKDQVQVLKQNQANFVSQNRNLEEIFASC